MKSQVLYRAAQVIRSGYVMNWFDQSQQDVVDVLGG